jgi:hypothetical protein
VIKSARKLKLAFINFFAETKDNFSNSDTKQVKPKIVLAFLIIRALLLLNFWPFFQHSGLKTLIKKHPTVYNFEKKF